MSNKIASIYRACNDKIISALAGGSDPVYISNLISSEFRKNSNENKEVSLLLLYQSLNIVEWSYDYLKFLFINKNENNIVLAINFINQKYF